MFDLRSLDLKVISARLCSDGIVVHLSVTGSNGKYQEQKQQENTPNEDSSICEVMV